MKKIFTLFAATMMAAGAMAQGVVLDANRIATFYKTFDGTSFEQLKGENGYESNNNLIKKFANAKPDGTNQNKAKFFPIALDGPAPNDMNDITLTSDYVDAETGFRVPAGRYTTLCCNDYISSSQTRKTINLYTSSTSPISNIKKLVVYVAGIGASRADDGTLYQDGIRINGTKLFNGDQVITNEVGGENATNSWLTRYVYNGVITSADNVPVYDPSTKKISSNTYTQDKLFRIVIDFKTPHDPDDAIGGKDKEGQPNENIVSANDGDGSYETKTDQACIDKSTGKSTCDERIYNVCHKFVDPDGDGTTGTGGKPGYYSYDWTWSKAIGQLLQIKKNYNLFAIALICGDDDAKTYISHVKDSDKATWEEIGTTGINAVNAESTKVAPRKQLVNGQIVIGDYNIAGQRVK